MSKASKIILCLSIVLVVLLCAVFCVEYFVLQVPVFDRGGWYTTKEGTVQFRDYYARPLTGWLEIEGAHYYFTDDGAMFTGWLQQDAERYYMGTDGKLRTGWQAIDGDRYFFSNKGTMTTGWVKLADSRVYLGKDGTLQTGWLEQPEGSYYLDPDGYPQTGWIEVDGLSYYLKEDGLLDTCWQDSTSGMRYIGQDGQAHTGWLKVPEGNYYFDDQGLMQTGWVYDGTARYYLYDDGTVATGFVQIDETERFFMPDGSYIPLVNEDNPVPEDYSPVLVKYGGLKVDESCHAALTELAAAAKKAGYGFRLNTAYRDLAYQQSLWNSRIRSYTRQGYSKEKATQLTAQTVAVPGTSEHQLGLSVDIRASGNLYNWLEKHSWEYGFILRYPKGKSEITGISYEPWHFRFVGKPLAKQVYDSGLCLEEYLESLKAN